MADLGQSEKKGDLSGDDKATWGGVQLSGGGKIEVVLWGHRYTAMSTALTWSSAAKAPEAPGVSKTVIVKKKKSKTKDFFEKYVTVTILGIKIYPTDSLENDVAKMHTVYKDAKGEKGEFEGKKNINDVGKKASKEQKEAHYKGNSDIIGGVAKTVFPNLLVTRNGVCQINIPVVSNSDGFA